MYNGSDLLVNCFCGHCVIFPYPRIPEPADGPADALFPAQRSVASGGHKRIRISVFLCRFSFLHTALSLRQIIAAVFCLGIFPGMAASLAGGSEACLLCYFIGRLLPVRLREKRLSKNIKGFSAFAIGLGVSMTFLGYSGPACLLLGALRLSSPVLIWGCFIGMLSEVAAYSLLCSPHSSFLPNNVLIIFRVAGVVLLCAALISAARKYSDI